MGTFIEPVRPVVNGVTPTLDEAAALALRVIGVIADDARDGPYAVNEFNIVIAAAYA